MMKTLISRTRTKQTNSHTDKTLSILRLFYTWLKTHWVNDHKTKNESHHNKRHKQENDGDNDFAVTNIQHVVQTTCIK
jgi:hypothetical protein